MKRISEMAHYRIDFKNLWLKKEALIHYKQQKHENKKWRVYNSLTAVFPISNHL